MCPFLPSRVIGRCGLVGVPRSENAKHNKQRGIDNTPIALSGRFVREGEGERRGEGAAGLSSYPIGGREGRRRERK